MEKGPLLVETGSKRTSLNEDVLRPCSQNGKRHDVSKSKKKTSASLNEHGNIPSEQKSVLVTEIEKGPLLVEIESKRSSLNEDVLRPSSQNEKRHSLSKSKEKRIASLDKHGNASSEQNPLLLTEIEKGALLVENESKRPSLNEDVLRSSSRSEKRNSLLKSKEKRIASLNDHGNSSSEKKPLLLRENEKGPLLVENVSKRPSLSEDVLRPCSPNEKRRNLSKSKKKRIESLNEHGNMPSEERPAVLREREGPLLAENENKCPSLNEDVLNQGRRNEKHSLSKSKKKEIASFNEKGNMSSEEKPLLLRENEKGPLLIDKKKKHPSQNEDILRPCIQNEKRHSLSKIKKKGIALLNESKSENISSEEMPRLLKENEKGPLLVGNENKHPSLHENVQRSCSRNEKKNYLSNSKKKKTASLNEHGNISSEEKPPLLREMKKRLLFEECKIEHPSLNEDLLRQSSQNEKRHPLSTSKKKEIASLNEHGNMPSKEIPPFLREKEERLLPVENENLLRTCSQNEKRHSVSKSKKKGIALLNARGNISSEQKPQLLKENETGPFLVENENKCPLLNEDVVGPCIQNKKLHSLSKIKKKKIVSLNERENISSEEKPLLLRKNKIGPLLAKNGKLRSLSKSEKKEIASLNEHGNVSSEEKPLLLRKNEKGPILVENENKRPSLNEDVPRPCCQNEKRRSLSKIKKKRIALLNEEGNISSKEKPLLLRENKKGPLLVENKNKRPLLSEDMQRPCIRNEKRRALSESIRKSSLLNEHGNISSEEKPALLRNNETGTSFIENENKHPSLNEDVPRPCSRNEKRRVMSKSIRKRSSSLNEHGNMSSVETNPLLKENEKASLLVENENKRSSLNADVLRPFSQKEKRRALSKRRKKRIASLNKHENMSSEKKPPLLRENKKGPLLEIKSIGTSLKEDIVRPRSQNGKRQALSKIKKKRIASLNEHGNMSSEKKPPFLRKIKKRRLLIENENKPSSFNKDVLRPCRQNGNRHALAKKKKKRIASLNEHGNMSSEKKRLFFGKIKKRRLLIENENKRPLLNRDVLRPFSQNGKRHALSKRREKSIKSLNEHENMSSEEKTPFRENEKGTLFVENENKPSSLNVDVPRPFSQNGKRHALSKYKAKRIASLNKHGNMSSEDKPPFLRESKKRRLLVENKNKRPLLNEDVLRPFSQNGKRPLVSKGKKKSFASLNEHADMSPVVRTSGEMIKVNVGVKNIRRFLSSKEKKNVHASLRKIKKGHPLLKREEKVLPVLKKNKKMPSSLRENELKLRKVKKRRTSLKEKTQGRVSLKQNENAPVLFAENKLEPSTLGENKTNDDMKVSKSLLSFVKKYKKVCLNQPNHKYFMADYLKQLVVKENPSRLLITLHSLEFTICVKFETSEKLICKSKYQDASILKFIITEEIPDDLLHVLHEYKHVFYDGHCVAEVRDFRNEEKRTCFIILRPAYPYGEKDGSGTHKFFLSDSGTLPKKFGHPCSRDKLSSLNNSPAVMQHYPRPVLSSLSNIHSYAHEDSGVYSLFTDNQNTEVTKSELQCVYSSGLLESTFLKKTGSSSRGADSYASSEPIDGFKALSNRSSDIRTTVKPTDFLKSVSGTNHRAESTDALTLVLMRRKLKIVTEHNIPGKPILVEILKFKFSKDDSDFPEFTGGEDSSYLPETSGDKDGSNLPHSTRHKDGNNLHESSRNENKSSREENASNSFESSGDENGSKRRWRHKIFVYQSSSDSQIYFISVHSRFSADDGPAKAVYYQIGSRKDLDSYITRFTDVFSMSFTKPIKVLRKETGGKFIFFYENKGSDPIIQKPEHKEAFELACGVPVVSSRLVSESSDSDDEQLSSPKQFDQGPSSAELFEPSSSLSCSEDDFPQSPADCSENISSDDFSESITSDDCSESITSDDLSEIITSNLPSPADCSEIITSNPPCRAEHSESPDSIPNPAVCTSEDGTQHSTVSNSVCSPEYIIPEKSQANCSALPDPGVGTSGYDQAASPEPATGTSEYYQVASPEPATGTSEHCQAASPKPATGTSEHYQPASPEPATDTSEHYQAAPPEPATGASDEPPNSFHSADFVKSRDYHMQAPVPPDPEVGTSEPNQATGPFHSVHAVTQNYYPAFITAPEHSLTLEQYQAALSNPSEFAILFNDVYYRKVTPDLRLNAKLQYPLSILETMRDTGFVTSEGYQSRDTSAPLDPGLRTSKHYTASLAGSSHSSRFVTSEGYQTHASLPSGTVCSSEKAYKPDPSARSDPSVYTPEHSLAAPSVPLHCAHTITSGEHQMDTSSPPNPVVGSSELYQVAPANPFPSAPFVSSQDYQARASAPSSSIPNPKTSNEGKDYEAVPSPSDYVYSPEIVTLEEHQTGPSARPDPKASTSEYSQAAPSDPFHSHGAPNSEDLAAVCASEEDHKADSSASSRPNIEDVSSEDNSVDDVAPQYPGLGASGNYQVVPSSPYYQAAPFNSGVRTSGYYQAVPSDLSPNADLITSEGSESDASASPDADFISSEGSESDAFASPDADLITSEGSESDASASPDPEVDSSEHYKGVNTSEDYQTTTPSNPFLSTCVSSSSPNPKGDTTDVITSEYYLQTSEYYLQTSEYYQTDTSAPLDFGVGTSEHYQDVPSSLINSGDVIFQFVLDPVNQAENQEEDSQYLIFDK